MKALKDALLARMRTAGSVTWARAPDGQTGTYAVAHLSFHPRDDGLTQLLDIRLDVISQTSHADCMALVQSLDIALNNYQLPGSGGLLSVGGVQDVSDQSDPLTTRLTMEVTGVWANPSRVPDLGGVS